MVFHCSSDTTECPRGAKAHGVEGGIVGRSSRFTPSVKPRWEVADLPKFSTTDSASWLPESIRMDCNEVDDFVAVNADGICHGSGGG